MTLLLSGTNGLSDVDGSAATPAVRGTDTNTGIFFPAADTIAFAEGGAEIARFDSSGNLGIGTSSPAVKLNVGVHNTNPSYSGGRQADSSLGYFGTSGSIGGIRILSESYNAATSAYLDLANFGSKDTGIPSGYRLSGAVGSGSGTGNPYLAFSRIQLNSGGTTITAVEQLRLDSDGLKFNGDTAAANALDDYEEGTWTPALSGYTGTTYGVDGQQGWYTKIGNVVVMHFYMEITSVGTFVTNSRITGAPFGAGPAVTSAVGNQPTVLTALNETRADHYMAQYLGGVDIFVYNNAGTARNGNNWKAGFIAGTLVTISY